MTTRRDRVRAGAENRYGLVLVLIAVTYALSAANLGSTGTAVVILVQLGLLWVVFTVSESPRAQRLAGIGIAIGGVIAVVSWFVTRASPDLRPAEQGLFVLSVLLYLIAPVVILRHLLSRDVVDVRSLLGAVCAYLLLGMMFAFTYRAIGSLQPDPPFFGSAGQGQTSDALFFSFVTLTTTGYGNLVPAANPGQSVAVIEAIVGQLFLIIAFSKVVTAWGTSRSRVPGAARTVDTAPEDAR